MEHIEWEYDAASVERFGIYSLLKTRGADGWEMCGAIQVSGFDIMFFFKRPKFKEH